MRRRTALVIAGALLGIVASASVAWLASQVAGQRIGLASEPASVAAGLVPRSAPDTAKSAPVRRLPTRKVRPGRPTTAPPAATPASPAAPTQAATAAPTVSPSPPASPAPRAPSGQHEDSGSGGSGSGGGGAGRDD